MTPQFILNSGYTAREVTLVLTRASLGKGWEFRGFADGYSVPARNAKGDILFDGRPFATQHDAAIMARALELPAYAVWNGRKRCYEGEGAKFMAYARDDKTPRLVERTAKASYWRMANGFRAFHPDATPGLVEAADNGSGYATLDAIKRLKGDSV